jgi:serine/threonine protein phosphatase PrpC
MAGGLLRSVSRLSCCRQSCSPAWHTALLTPCCSAAAAAVLKDAADTVEENGIQGSSTCCLVMVDTLQGRLTSANIGDSGFVLIGRRYP